MIDDFRDECIPAEVADIVVSMMVKVKSSLISNQFIFFIIVLKRLTLMTESVDSFPEIVDTIPIFVDSHLVCSRDNHQ